MSEALRNDMSGDISEILIDAETLEARVRELGGEISAD